MSTIAAKNTERNGDERARRDHVCVPSASFTSDGKEIGCIASGADGEQEASTNHYPRKTHRRQECATVFNIVLTAQPNVARSVRESLASYGTTPGEPPFVQRSALTASRPVETTTADFCPRFRSPNDSGGDHHAAISRSLSFWSKVVAQ